MERGSRGAITRNFRRDALGKSSERLEIGLASFSAAKLASRPTPETSLCSLDIFESHFQAREEDKEREREWEKVLSDDPLFHFGPMV